MTQYRIWYLLTLSWGIVGVINLVATIRALITGQFWLVFAHLVFGFVFSLMGQEAMRECDRASGTKL